jgi:hypothetical protein
MSTIINATTTNGVVIQPDNSGSLVLQTNNGTTALTIDTSQRAAFVAGTAAAPAITTTGDTNTGMFFPAADTIAFAEGGAEAMRLDSSGNLLLGETSQVYFSRFTLSYNPSSSNGPIFLSTVAQAQDYGGALAFGGKYNSAGNYRPFAGMYGAKSNSTDGNSAGYLAFQTNGNAADPSERMRIDSNGTVCINTTAPPSSDNRLTITYSSATQSAASIKNTSTTFNGNMWSFINSSNASCGAITQTGTTTTAFTTSSDYRLKENIAPMTGALDMVAQLKPVTYTWKEDGSSGQGFIAHELQEIVPDCVIGEKDAVNEDGSIKVQGVDTSFLVATLTAAIQEQQTIINDLKARVEALEAK